MMRFNRVNNVLIGLIGLCFYVAIINSLCTYNDKNYCSTDTTYPVKFYTCGGVTSTDNSYFAVTSNKYCQPIKTLPTGGPCAGLYASGGGVCSPNRSGTGVDLSLYYTAISWNSQLKTVGDIYNACKNGSKNPYEGYVPSSQMEKNSQGGPACCDTWYNNQVSINWCHSASCYCPPPCSNPAINVELPYTTTYGSEANPSINTYCFSDCTDCMNLYYGARSNAYCTSPGYTESAGQYFPFGSSSSCSCCRLYNGTTPNPSTNPSTTPSRIASTSASPSTALQRPTQTSTPSRSSLPAPTGGASYSNTPSRSDLPSASPSSSLINVNGTEESSILIDNDSKNLSGGAIAGIVIGSIAGFFLLLLIVAIVVGVIVFLVVRARRSSSIQGVASPGGTMYNAGV